MEHKIQEIYLDPSLSCVPEETPTWVQGTQVFEKAGSCGVEERRSLGSIWKTQKQGADTTPPGRQKFIRSQ
jgi:hypothetical protein